jgi:hypothetical protein
MRLLELLNPSRHDRVDKRAARTREGHALRACGGFAAAGDAGNQRKADSENAEDSNGSLHADFPLLASL